LRSGRWETKLGETERIGVVVKRVIMVKRTSVPGTILVMDMRPADVALISSADP
jgi:hypothetical protein